MSNFQPGTFEEFEREAERGNVVPLVRTVSAHSHTPIDAYLRIAADARYAFLWNPSKAANELHATLS